MDFFNSEGYFVAEVDGKIIEFVSYSEYLDYIKDKSEEKDSQQG